MFREYAYALTPRVGRRGNLTPRKSCLRLFLDKGPSHPSEVEPKGVVVMVIIP